MYGLPIGLKYFRLSASAAFNFNNFISINLKFSYSFFLILSRSITQIKLPSQQMSKKFSNKIIAISSVLIAFLFILNIEAKTFGIEKSEIPLQYVKFFTENWAEDYIQWQIGAFMIDEIILNEIGKIKEMDKNVRIEEFERKFNKYKELKNKMKKKKNMKYGWEEVWKLFSELISDEYLEEQILKNNKFEEEKWKKIKEIQNWNEMREEEQNGIIEWNLKILIQKFHRNEMEKLLLNQSELLKAIQQMNIDSNNKNITEEKKAEMEEIKRKKFEIMKMGMRKMVGAEWTFKHLEKREPILMRYDIIEPTELFRIYKLILTVSTNKTKQEEYEERLGIAIVFGEVWKLRNIKPGFRDSLKELWKLYLSSEISNEGKTMEEKLLDKWVELKTGIISPKDDFEKFECKITKYDCVEEIHKMHKEQFLKIFDKEREEFMKFLDENVGSRARILRIFGRQWELESTIDQIFITGNEMTEMLRIEPNEEKIEEMFRLNYLVALRTKNELAREKAALRIFILFGVEHLDKEFGNEGGDLEKEWTEKYRPMFFFYLDQTADDWKLCEENGIIYRIMLYKLRKFMLEKNWKNEDWNLHSELIVEFIRLRRDHDEGMMNPEAYKDEKEMLKQDNKKIISKLREKFSELDSTIRDLQFDYFSWNSNFLAPYKEYIMENDEEKMEELKEQVNLDATLWHYKNIFDNLFESLNKKLDKSSWPIRFINNWEYLKKYKARNYQAKIRKLCELQYFIENSLAKNDDIKKLNEWEYFMNLPRITNINCDDGQRIEGISLLIVEQHRIEIKKKIYYDYLDWLITNFEEFQQFLLELDSKFKLNIINILNVQKKDGLEKFELFGKLEKKHPKWLKIDEMNMNMRMELYKTILKIKDYLPESKNSQKLIAMATMIGEIKKAQKASEKCGLGVDYPEHFETIKRQIAKLLEEIYKKGGENFDSKENICILTGFRQLIKMEMEYIGEEQVYCLKYSGKENLIKEYNGALCKKEDMQDFAWDLQKEYLEKQHQHFLLEMSQSNLDNGEIKKLIKKFGGMNRLWLLVPNSTESPFLPEKDFAMDYILREHFLEALYAQNEEDRVANKLAVNYFSWARHIDKKLENLEKMENSDGTNPTILAQIWQKREIRIKLLNKYDGLGNTKLDSLKARKIYLARFHLDILELIEKTEKEVFTKEKLEEIFDQILRKWKYVKYDKEWEWEENKDKKLTEYFNRIHEFNREELLEQFNTHISLGNEIIESLKNKDAKNIFVQLIGGDGINKMWEKFKPKIEENIQKGNELAEIESNVEEETVNENSSKKEIIEEKSGISSNKENFEMIENAPSSPKKFIPANGTEFAESSGYAPNPILTEKIQQHSSKAHSEDSELYNAKREVHQKKEETFEGKNKTIESKKISGDSAGPKKENEIKKVLRKKNSMRSNQKFRKNRKERKARKKAEQEEKWRNKAREKAEADKITLEEEKKQINEHLIIEELVEMLKNKGYGEFTDPDANEESEKRRMARRKKYLNQSEFIILEMMEILAKWNKESRMLISGSMQLKLNSIDSDIDLIVLLPYETNENWANEFEKNFMSDPKSKCVKNKCENGDQISLYCFLCQAEKVFLLEKICGNVPLIKTRKRNISVDINMALVPKELLRNFPTIDQQQQKFKNYKKMKKKMEEIMENQPSLDQIDELIRNIIIQIGKEQIEKEQKEKRENVEINENDIKRVIELEYAGTKMLRLHPSDKRNGMIFTLSGYRANKQIIELLPKEENYRNFQIAYSTLKLWLKNHFIYGGIFGFINGTTLSVMICKLAMELGENASAIEIVEQFFHKYHKRENEVLERIQLEFKKNYRNISNVLDWFPYENAKGWQVITPGFPTQNAAFAIIPPSDRIINAELGNGLEKVGKIRKLIEMASETSPETIHGMLTNFIFSSQKFEDKYPHFMAIVCKNPPKNENALAFCNFLQLKLRIELPKIDVPQIDYFHIKPEKILDKKICSKQFRPENEEKFCTIWLAGIKLKDDINIENVELEAAINESSKQLIVKIKEEFYRKFPEAAKEEEKFDIIFYYFSKKDLPKWN